MSLHPPRLHLPLGPVEAEECDDPFALPWGEYRKRLVEEAMTEYLTAKLTEAQGNISAAARAAGMDRANFKRLMHKANVTVADVCEVRQ